METNEKKTGHVPAGLTAEDAAYVRKRGPLPVYGYRRKDARRHALLVRAHLEAVGRFTAADHLTRVMAGKELQKAEALLLGKAVAELHAELAGGTRTGGPGKAGSVPVPVRTEQDARVALGRAVGLLKELAASKEDMAQCLMSALRLEDSLAWRAPGDARPAKAGAHTAEQDLSRLLSRLLSGLLEAERALRDSARALDGTLRSDPGEAGHDADLRASLGRARGDLAGLRTAVEKYHDTMAQLCGDLWERAVDTARAEFTGAVDHYDPAFALKITTFKAAVTVLSAACTAASAVCPPLSAVTVGIAVAGFLGPGAALKSRAARETADPTRVVELLRTKVVPTRKLDEAARDRSGTGRAAKNGLRSAANRSADVLDTTNEAFGVGSNVLSAGSPFQQEMATAAAALAENVLLMTTTPAGAAVGLVSVVRDAAASELRTPVPVGDEEARGKLPGDARAVVRAADPSLVRPARAQTPANRPGAVPLPNRCTAAHAFRLWNEVTLSWFVGRAVFTLHRADAATLREYGPCMVVDGLTVDFDDVYGTVRPMDLSRTSVVAGVLVTDLASAVGGTLCAARVDPTGEVELLNPERFLPDEIDVVQACSLLDPQYPGRVLDPATPYYQLGYARLHVSYAGPGEQDSYAWQVENLYETLPQVEAEPFARWLEQAQETARTRTQAAVGQDYEDARS
ncbi:hypothetical protein [Streptomyces sp. NBC_01264]|uniref:hypothetical protein n=1 Tax=Streptomyces sp. NBC_01264 TaxID=2903804 RepID=UPI0022577C11|nr:hypothetical protein [Streptomyces sp. NBC_01264]MCX4781818.1 hypothetical protein [Streptomyces sp. NBC_01264]